MQATLQAASTREVQPRPNLMNLPAAAARRVMSQCVHHRRAQGARRSTEASRRTQRTRLAPRGSRPRSVFTRGGSRPPARQPRRALSELRVRNALRSSRVSDRKTLKGSSTRTFQRRHAERRGAVRSRNLAQRWTGRGHRICFLTLRPFLTRAGARAREYQDLRHAHHRPQGRYRRLEVGFQPLDQRSTFLFEAISERYLTRKSVIPPPSKPSRSVAEGLAVALADRPVQLATTIHIRADPYRL